MGEQKGFLSRMFSGLAKTYGRKVAFGLLLVLVGFAAFVDALHVAGVDASKALDLFFTHLQWVGGIVVAGNMSEHVSKGFGGKDKVTPPADASPPA